MAKVIGIILASAAVSFFLAVLSISEEVIRLFAVINVACAVLAIAYALSNKQRIAVFIASSPVPLGIASVIVWTIILNVFPFNRHWEEVVQLSTGREIVIQRGFKSVDGREMDYDIDAEFSRLGHVKWNGTITPIAFDEDKSGNVYLVTLRRGGDVAFKYSESKQWIQIPIEQVPLEMKPNLLFDLWRQFKTKQLDTKQLVTLSVKQSVHGYGGNWRHTPQQ